MARGDRVSILKMLKSCLGKGTGKELWDQRMGRCAASPRRNHRLLQEVAQLVAKSHAAFVISKVILAGL